MTGLQRESLQGWDIDTVAAAVADLCGHASALGYEQLRSYTGGLPLYVESAARVAAEEYKGDMDRSVISSTPGATTCIARYFLFINSPVKERGASDKNQTTLYRHVLSQ
ncbi:hypothetical protein ACE60L_002715 [Salmonella enterica]